MPGSTVSTLLIGAIPSDALSLREALDQDYQAQFTLTVAARLDHGLDLLERHHYDIVLLDLELPDSRGLATLKQLRRRYPQLPVVVFSGLADEQAAVAAVQAGAQDYIVKGQAGWAWAPRAIRYALDRHQAQADLRASEQRFRSLIENSADVIALLSVDGTIRYESPSVTAALGYQPEEMVGRIAFEFLHPDDTPAATALFGQLLEQPDTKITFQCRFRHRDGSWHWVDAVGTNLLAEPGVGAIVINYRDITASKQTQQELLQAQQLAQATIDALTAHICVLDETGRIISVNRAWNAFAEANPPRPPDAGLGMNYLEVCERAEGEDAETAALVAQGIRAVLSGDAPQFSLEYPCDSPTTRRWFSVLVTRFSGDGPSRLAISHENITERNEAEARRDESEQLFRLLAETLEDVIWQADARLHFTYLSPSVEKLYGYTPEALLGKSVLELVPAHAQQEAREVATRLLERLRQRIGLSYGHIQLEQIRQDGSTFWAEILANVRYDHHGAITSIQGVTRDISTRKQAELLLEERVRERTAELEAIRQRLELATRAAGIGIWDWDLASDRLVWDEQMLRLYGLSREVFDGSADTYRHSVHPDDIPEQLRLLDGILGDDLGYDSEFRVLWPDGSEHHLQANAVKLWGADGRLERIIGVNYDITVRKQAENLLRHSEETLRRANSELERAMRMKDEFLASMSHELRTPLNGILGFSEALQEQVYGGLNERQLRALTMIESSGRHLLALINDILDISKIEAGKLELQIEPCSLDELSQASLLLIRGLAQKKRQSLDFNISPPQMVIQADTRRLKQILVNLLSNAVKFTPEGGALGLDVRGSAQDQTVRLSVWDSGVGIRPDDLRKLFQPFVQLDSSLARQHSGTGLGLSLVQRLVALHGGSVELESSTPGEGSCFTVILPWQPSPAPQQPREPMRDSSAAQRPMTVEDKPFDAERL